jgi:hypothetical protein
MKKYISLLIPLIILIAICLYGIEKQYMWSDEVYSFHAAEMILEKGEPIYDSGLIYARSPIYHKLLSISMDIFGSNELGSRLLNIPFWLGTSFVIFLFVYNLVGFVKGERRPLLALATAIFYLISNFGIAMLRETRMYGMSTFFFVLSTYFLYKGLIATDKKYSIKILRISIDWRYALAFIPTFLVAFNTQPINIILGLGILVFFLVSGILNKNIVHVGISILIGIAGVLLTYLMYGTFDLLEIFSELSPSWAMDSSILYYSILTVRNMPFVILAVPIAIYMTLWKKKIEIIYLSSIVLSFLVFLSFQNAQHERYWQAIVPLIIILSSYIFVLFFKNIRIGVYKKILLIALLISSIFHVYLSTKEITEIDTYTQTSLSIHKKLQYNSLEKYLNENMTESDLLIADFHSTYTLYQKGFTIDYLLLPKNDVNWIWEDKDLYFDIPLINENELKTLLENENGYLIIRDSENFKEFTNIMRIYQYNRPKVYRF